MNNEQWKDLANAAYKLPGRDFQRRLTKYVDKSSKKDPDEKAKVENAMLETTFVPKLSVDPGIEVCNLLHALMLGNLKVFKKKIENNPEFLQTIYYGDILLGLAINSGNIEILKEVIALYQKFDRSLFEFKNHNGHSAIVQALHAKNEDMIKALIDAGVSLEATIKIAVSEGSDIREQEVSIADYIWFKFSSLRCYLPRNESIVDLSPRDRLLQVMHDNYSMDDEVAIKALMNWTLRNYTELFENIEFNIHLPGLQDFYSCNIFLYACLLNAKVAERMLCSIEEDPEDRNELLHLLLTLVSIKPVGLDAVDMAFSSKNYDFAIWLAKRYRLPLNPMNQSTGLNRLHLLAQRGQWDAFNALAAEDPAELSLQSLDIIPESRGWLPFHYAAARSFKLEYCEKQKLFLVNHESCKRQMIFFIDWIRKQPQLMKVTVSYSSDRGEKIENCTPIHLLILNGTFPLFIELAQQNRVIGRKEFQEVLTHESGGLSLIDFVKKYGNDKDLRACHIAGLAEVPTPIEGIPEKPLKTEPVPPAGAEPSDVDIKQLVEEFSKEEGKKFKKRRKGTANLRLVRGQDKPESSENTTTDRVENQEIEEARKNASTQTEGRIRIAAMFSWFKENTPWERVPGKGPKVAFESEINPPVKENHVDASTQYECEWDPAFDYELSEENVSNEASSQTSDGAHPKTASITHPEAIEHLSQLKNPVITAKLKIGQKEHGIVLEDIPNYVRKIAKRLAGAGFNTCVVGGAIRDLLLAKNIKNLNKLSPSDWDLLTDAPPEKVLDLFPGQSKFIGRRLGLIHIETEGDSDSEKNIVVETSSLYKNGLMQSWEDNAKQRDFTMNGLMYNITDGSSEQGIIYDSVGGYHSIKKQELKAIGDPNTSFTYDACRILRGIRLSTRCMGQIKVEQDTYLAMCFNIDRLSPNQSGRSATLSNPSRIFGEVLKLFNGGYAIANRNEVFALGLQYTQSYNWSNPLLFFIIFTRDVEQSLKLTDQYVADNPHADKESISAYLLAMLIKAQYIYYYFKAKNAKKEVVSSELVRYLCSRSFADYPYTWQNYVKAMTEILCEITNPRQTLENTQSLQCGF